LNLTIKYHFNFDDGSEETFALLLDQELFKLQSLDSQPPPAWTSLDFKQCPNCPLDKATHPQCPVAVNLTQVVNRFADVISHDAVTLRVETEQRSVTVKGSAQEGISSLLGLIMATSDCPHTAYFRPMARFHLPFASELETTYRSTSMFLLGQYFRNLDGQAMDLQLKGLKEVYEALRIVNKSLADRLRSASESDSALNAVVLLDIYAMVVPDAIEESLEELRPMFKGFL